MRHGMSQERYAELSRNHGLFLTATEVADGWHFCLDRDGLLIHESDPECECCTCPYNKNN